VHHRAPARYVSRYRAAELILDRSFEGAAKVFFTNGGTEAMEHAIRLARLSTGRHKGVVGLSRLPRRHRDVNQPDR